MDEIYPSPTLLRMSREAGLAITLASDYHSPDGAGWGHDAVVAAARAAGYTHRAAFRAPARTLVPLPDPSPGAPAGVTRPHEQPAGPAALGGRRRET